MNIRVDISLSNRYGVVERAIFRLVLNGYTDAGEIGQALSLFSRPVVANGMRHLVNSQILIVDAESGQLGIAEPLMALLDMCLEGDVILDVPDELCTLIQHDGILIDSGTSRATREFKPMLRQLKASLVERLVPGVNLGHYVDAFDFTLTDGERGE